MSKEAVVSWNVGQNRWEACYQGRVLVKNTNMEKGAEYCKNAVLTTSQKAKNLGITSVRIEGIATGAGQTNGAGMMPDFNAPTIESEFSIDERFDILGSYVRMVSQRELASTLITGDGGLGKSYTCMESLRAAGLEDLTEMEIGAAFDGQRGYKVTKGYSTAKGLYRTLYDNKDQIMVFDDCDSILRDPTAVNILKAALDSYDKRIVSWNAEGWGSDENLPKSFEFKGGVIFISNMAKSKVPQAIRSRAMCADVSMTRNEVVTRMWTLVKNGKFLADVDMQAKKEAMAFVEANAFHQLVRELNLRTLINVVKARQAQPGNWERLALYSMYGA